MRLPIQFEPELDLAFAGLRGARKLAGGGNHIAGAIQHLGLGSLEIRPVEEVESFRTKLQSKSFTPQGPILEQREVIIFQAGTAQSVASQISQLPQGWPGETLRLNVVRRIAGINGIHRATGERIEIGPLPAGTAADAAVAGASPVGLNGDGERSARSRGE